MSATKLTTAAEDQIIESLAKETQEQKLHNLFNE